MLKRVCTSNGAVTGVSRCSLKGPADTIPYPAKQYPLKAIFIAQVRGRSGHNVVVA